MALTQSIKWTAELDPMSECNEGKQSGQNTKVAVSEDEKVELIKEKESKLVMGGAVSNESVRKVNLQFIKCNVEYWEGKKAASLNGKGK